MSDYSQPQPLTTPFNDPVEFNPFGLRQHERTALFIDGANLFGATRAIGLRFEFDKVLTHIQARCDFLRGYYFTALSDDEPGQSNPVRSLTNWIERSGYTIISKPVKSYYNRLEDKTIYKGNLDVEIATKILQLTLPVRPFPLHHIILFSGDGDFRYLLEVVQDLGVRTTVCSTEKSPRPYVSEDLISQTDNFVDLADLGPILTSPRRD